MKQGVVNNLWNDLILVYNFQTSTFPLSNLPNWFQILWYVNWIAFACGFYQATEIYTNPRSDHCKIIFILFILTLTELILE